MSEDMEATIGGCASSWACGCIASACTGESAPAMPVLAAGVAATVPAPLTAAPEIVGALAGLVIHGIATAIS